MLRDIYLHGKLGRQFGRHHRYDVKHPAEALRALCATRKGFREAFEGKHYRFVRGGRGFKDIDLTAEQLKLGFGRENALHIIPTPAVSGAETLIWAAVALTAAIAVAVIFTPQIKTPSQSDRESEKNSFVFDGPINSNEQGGPVPIICGRMTVGSTVGSGEIRAVDIPYTSLPDTGLSTGGFVGSPLGRDLVFGEDNLLIVDKGGKGGGAMRAAQEDPNSLQSSATAYFVDIIGEGECELVDGLKSVRLDGTPVMNTDGTLNFKGFSLAFREGLPTQSYVPGFGQQANTIPVDVEVSTQVGPIVKTISSDVVNQVRVTLGVNGFYYQDATNGDLKKTSVVMKIELQSNGGGYTTVVEHTISGKQTGAYEKQFDIALTGSAPWDIRVTRVTPDRAEANYNDTVNFVSYTELIDAKLTYPDTCYAAGIVDAKQFGSKIAQRSYDVYGVRMDVPTNYDPVTRTYATTGPGTTGGIWDGTFKRAWADEGAWFFREVCLNSRWGMGRKLTDDSVDKWELYEISLHNSEHVPDGLGGTEPRHSLNCCINTREPAQNVLSAIAASFRAKVYFSSGAVHLVQDRPALSINRLITPSNTVNEEIDYDTTDIEETYSAYVVAWNDPEDEHRLAFEVVEDPVLRQQIGWKAKDVTAWGCAVRGEAVRFGKRLLNDQTYCAENASWLAGFDQADLVPGTVVNVNEAEFSEERLGGRVLSSTTTSAVLDYPITIEADVDYTFKVMMRDGTVAERPLTNAPGETSTVTWSTPLAVTPIDGAVWAMETSELSLIPWRIEGRVEQEEGLQFAIKARRYDPDQWDRVEQGLKLEPRPVSDLPSGALEIPSGLGYLEFVKLLSGDAGSPSVYFSWKAATDTRVTAYQAQVKRPGSSDFEYVPYLGGLGVEINSITEGEHKLRVRSNDALGRVSAWREITDTFDGLPAPPLGVVSFEAYPGEDGVRFVWTPVVSVSPLVYEIRQGETWETGQRICRVRDDTITIKLPTSAILNQLFWIKPYILGSTLYSADALFATTYQAPLPTRNIIVANDFQALGFTGRLRHLELATVASEDALKLMDDAFGVRYPHGDYRTSVTLTDTFYARNWVESTPQSFLTSTATWDDLDVSWDDLGLLTWSPEMGSLTDVAIQNYIATAGAPTDMIEQWTFSALDFTGDIASTAPTIQQLVSTAGDGLWADGVALGLHSLLGYEGNVPFTETFTYALDYRPQGGAPADNAVFMTLSDGMAYLQLSYDEVTEEIVLTDDLAVEVRVPAPVWSTTDIYTFAVVQSATERKIAWVAQDDETSEFASIAATPRAVFDTIYVGSGGSSGSTTWAEADFTWADPEAESTWASVLETYFACVGSYSNAALRSSSDLNSSNYVARLLQRATAGYSDFRPLVPGDYSYENARIWTRISGPTGVGEDLYLTAHTLYVDVPDVIDGGTTAIGASVTVVPFNRVFHEPPDSVGAVHKGGAAPLLVNIVSIGLTSFEVKLVDPTSPSTLVAGTIVWSAKGY